MEDLLAIDSSAEYDNTLNGLEYHTHRPYSSATFGNNDEIRIPIHQQDVITIPFQSTLHIRGTLKATKNGEAAADVSLVNNAIAFLFDDIRYEIGGNEIDRTRNVGITTTIKNLLSLRENEKNKLGNCGWLGVGKTNSDCKEFNVVIPLRMLMGFFEDYNRIVVNVKQELVLLRSSSNFNAIVSADATDVDLKINTIYWRVPHVSVADQIKLNLLKMIERDVTVHVPHRKWELIEYPGLPATKQLTWTVKTTSQLEKPRYVIFAMQTDRKNKINSNASEFDGCKVTDVKLYLNSQYFPYDNILGDTALLYDMYVRFQQSYYSREPSPCLDLSTFKAKAPIFVIDCSKQNDTIKSGPVDVRLEIEASDNIPPNTSGYCLIIHDSHIVYNLLSGVVKKIT